MRYAKMVGLVLALALLAGALPAAAQGGNPAVTDEGNNVYLVDGAKGPIPNLLPTEEVAKIRELVFSVPGNSHRIVSPVSPDDQTVLVTAPGPLFLSLSDGSTVPLNAVVPGATSISNYFWLDGDTIGQYVIVIDSQINPYLITSDRRSGASKATPIDPAGGFPVFASANGRRVLYATQPAVDGSTAAAASVLVALAQMFNPFDEITTNIISDFTSLYVRDSVTGETRVVANLAPGARVENAAFSQDGNLFAITFIEGYPATTRDRYDGALVSELIYRDVTGNLPPAENPYFATNKLITLDFGSGQLQTLRAVDGDGVVYTDVSWSPDNQTLLVKVDQPSRLVGRRYPLYQKQFRSGSSLRFYNRELQEIRRLERIELSDVELQAFFVSPDEVIIQSQYRLDRRPWYYNLRSGELRDLATRAGTYQTLTPTNSSRRLLFSYSSVSEAPDFYSMN